MRKKRLSFKNCKNRLTGESGNSKKTVEVRKHYILKYVFIIEIFTQDDDRQFLYTAPEELVEDMGKAILEKMYNKLVRGKTNEDIINLKDSVPDYLLKECSFDILYYESEDNEQDFKIITIPKVGNNLLVCALQYTIKNL